MMAITEPGNALTNPKTAALKNPEGWSRDIQSFQQTTIRSSIRELLIHAFMAYTANASSGYLAPLVLIARKTARHDYE